MHCGNLLQIRFAEHSDVTNSIVYVEYILLKLDYQAIFLDIHSIKKIYMKEVTWMKAHELFIQQLNILMSTFHCGI